MNTAIKDPYFKHRNAKFPAQLCEITKGANHEIALLFVVTKRILNYCGNLKKSKEPEYFIKMNHSISSFTLGGNDAQFSACTKVATTKLLATPSYPSYP